MVGSREKSPEIPSAGLAGDLLIGLLGGISPGERREFTDPLEGKQIIDILLSLPVDVDGQIIYRASGGEKERRGLGYCGDCGGKRDIYWVTFRNTPDLPSLKITHPLVACLPCRGILFSIELTSREELKRAVGERGQFVQGIYHLSSEDLKTLAQELSYRD